MTDRFRRFLLTGVAGCAVLCIGAGPVFGQKKDAKDFTVAKTWNDQPDLQGIWHPAKPVDNLEKGGVIKDPANGKIPYVAGGAAKRNENAKNAKSKDLVNRCYMPGVPRLMYMGYPFQIFETKNYVAIVSEYAHVYRMIYLDGSPHLDFPDLWDGDSRGHWEGNTLVTDVNNFNDQTWLDKAGNYHSDKLHVTERISRQDAETLRYEITINDPDTWTKPWSMMIPLQRSAQPVYEYACHEGNIGLAGILAGARADEAKLQSSK